MKGESDRSVWRSYQATAQRGPEAQETKAKTPIAGKGEMTERRRVKYCGGLLSYDIYSTPWLSALPPSPVKEPNLRPASMATISAKISNTSLGTVLSYIEIRSLG